MNVLQRLAFSILIMLSLALLPGLSSAAITLTPTSSGISLNTDFELLEDSSAQLTIADMADPAIQSRFQPANGRASVGQSLNPWWIKVTLQRTSDCPQPVVAGSQFGHPARPAPVPAWAEWPLAGATIRRAGQP